MSAKRDLADLFSLLEKPTSEFVTSESFKRLEKEVDVIKYIEPFGLPEVKKLICCSAELAEQEWAAKYSDARRLYCADASLDVFELLMQYIDITKFENKILMCVDGSILGRINDYFTQINQEMDRAKKERSSLKGKIAKARKQAKDAPQEKDSLVEKNIEGIAIEGNSDEAAASSVKSEDELRLEKLNDQITEFEKSIEAFREHYEKAKTYLNQITNVEVMDAQRQKAYKAIDEIQPSVEEEFLIQYISDGELTTENEQSLRNYGFLQKFVALFEKTDYRNVAFPVLAKLYSDNAIDLECDLIAHFIGTHNRMLSEYLEKMYLSNPSYLEDTENRIFLEYSIKESIGGSNDYVTWWNTINKTSDWKIILKTADDVVDESLLKIATTLMHHVSGTSMDAFMELIQSTDVEKLGITPAEFIVEFIAQESPEQKDLVKSYIYRTDQSIRKLQRKLAAKEREINRYSQELFTSVYHPLEQLEELAVNLKHSDGEIKCSLVASHVIPALADLRVGLSAMGLETADEIESWKMQFFVDYDPQKHRMPSTPGSKGKKVKLQTLGFSYTDDDGNQKIRAAEVYIPAPVQKRPSKASVAKVSVQNKINHPENAAPSKKKRPHMNMNISNKPSKSTQKGEKK